MREQPEKRLPGPVGTDDGGVLAEADGQRQAIEDAAVVLDDAGIGELEDRFARVCSRIWEVAIEVGKCEPTLTRKPQTGT